MGHSLKGNGNSVQLGNFFLLFTAAAAAGALKRANANANDMDTIIGWPSVLSATASIIYADLELAQHWAPIARSGD